MQFELKAPFTPTGDQPEAISGLLSGIEKGLQHQTLLGVTGSGKTFTMANCIAKSQRPTLIISHNKTLAAQLYQEFRDFFPNNAVCYFVSYYDFYQPEAYIPQSDTYIEKETEINEKIDMLRLSATANLLTRPDTIIVASVSCIYNLGSPKEYGNFILELKLGVKLSPETIMARLVDLQYSQSSFDFKRGTFRVRGESIDLYPAYEEVGIRIEIIGDHVKSLTKINVFTGRKIENLQATVIYPAKHYMTDPKRYESVFAQIRKDLDSRVRELQDNGKKLEAYRLAKRVNFDLEMVAEMGYVNGIENYSRYFDGRKPGDPPYSLLEYFREVYKDKWLLFIDESHMTIPQIRGMYNGDYSRKKTLVDFGFRLPAAFDNRPLRFEEFLRRIPQTIYVSATPAEWEISHSKEEAKQKLGKSTDCGIVEQLVRPTGITDPIVTIRKTTGQIMDLVREIFERKKRGERVLVTTLTKRMAEDLAAFLNEKKYLEDKEYKSVPESQHPVVQYLHSDIETLERSDILDDLRGGKYDVLIGINLLREGLDLPEVSLVAILDADKEGFLRSETSLIQTMGRAARHIHGAVIMYADQITASMQRAIMEIDRRRLIQQKYNKKYHLKPVQITKPIREKLVEADVDTDTAWTYLDQKKRTEYRKLLSIDESQLTPRDMAKLIKKLEKEMRFAAGELNFELAAEIRDKIREIKITQ